MPVELAMRQPALRDEAAGEVAQFRVDGVRRAGVGAGRDELGEGASGGVELGDGGGDGG